MEFELKIEMRIDFKSCKNHPSLKNVFYNEANIKEQ